MFLNFYTYSRQFSSDDRPRLWRHLSALQKPFDLSRTGIALHSSIRAVLHMLTLCLLFTRLPQMPCWREKASAAA